MPLPDIPMDILSQNDLSWFENLKLTNSVNQGLLLEETTHSSDTSSPRQSSESLGYGSNGDNSPPSQSQSLEIPSSAPSSSLVSQSKNNLPLAVSSSSEKIPLWSPRYRTSEQPLYSFISPKTMAFTSQEVEIGLQSECWTRQLSLDQLQGLAVHSTGVLSKVKLESTDKSATPEAFTCKFSPRFPGRYFLKVGRTKNIQDFEISDDFNVSALKPVTPSLEILVTRNYRKESQFASMPAIHLEPNMDKYWGISLDDFSNRLYVTDRLNNDVIIMDPMIGKPIHRFGQEKSYCGKISNLFRPTGITVDHANKRIIICDKDNSRISFFSLDGHYISSFGKKGHAFGEFNYPWDVCCTRAGDLIAVSDSRNHRIQVFDRFGNYIGKYSVFDTDPFEYKKYFDYPRGVTFDNDGKYIYCTDFHTNNVLSLCVNTWETRLLAPPGKMVRPQGITVDEVGQLIVCDSRRNCIRVMGPNGDLVMTIDKVMNQDLSVPTDVCVTRWGQLIVLNLSGKIQIF